MTLEQVLVFSTGASIVPTSMGFDLGIEVEFTKSNYPKASTCDITLSLLINCHLL